MAHREKIARAIERTRTMDRRVVRVIVEEVLFVAAAGPFDWPTKDARHVDNCDVFGIRQHLCVEGAADIMGDDMHLVQRHVQRMLAKIAQELEKPPRGRHYFVTIDRGIVGCNRCALLERDRHRAIIGELQAGNMGDTRESSLDRCNVAEPSS